MSPPPAERTSLAIRLFAGAAVLAVGALVRMWFTAPGVSAGLWGVELCDPGCHGVRWDNLRGVDFDVIVAGYTATVASLVGAALVFATAVKQLGGARGPVGPAKTAVTVALAAMAWFLIRLLVDDAGIDVLAVLVPGVTIGTWFTLRRA